MDYIVNLTRYYNRKDESFFKGTKQLLFRSGDVFQGTEANELQSLSHEEIKSISEEIVINGQVIKDATIDILYDGSSYIPSKSPASNYDVAFKCNSGVLYLSEYFTAVNESTIDVGNKTLDDFNNYNNTIGIILTYIMDTDDATDPAYEYDNYGNSGAPFLKFDTEWSLGTVDVGGIPTDIQTTLTSEQKFIPIYIIEDGEVRRFVEITPLDKKIINIAAKYDRNSNGNYVIEGYNVSFVDYDLGTDNDLASGPFKFDVSAGSANVYGYNYEARTAQKMYLPQMTDTATILNEPISYTGAGWYDVSHTPLYKINEVSGPVKTTDENHVGAFTASAGSPHDVLADNTPLFNIESVTRLGGDQSTLVQGTDYEKNGDNIRFFVDMEAEGFKVTYLWNQTTQDFSGLNEIYGDETGEISTDKQQVYLTGFESGNTIYVEYVQMYSRVDTIILTSEGNLEYIQGIGDEYYPKANKSIDKSRQMSLAEVTLEYGKEPVVKVTGQRVWNMSDISLLHNGVTQNQYNLNKLALVTNMMLNNPTAPLRNTFVDDFNDNSKRWDLDLGTALTMSGNLIMGITWKNYQIDASNFLSSEEKDFLTLDSTTITSPILQQEWYTKSRLINEYIFKAPPTARIDVNPRVYKWITETNYNTFVKSQQEATREVTTTTNRRWWWWWWIRPFDNWANRWGWWGWRWWGQRNRTQSDVTREIINTTTDTATTIIENEQAEIIPQINLKLSSNTGAFNSNESVHVWFDGEQLSDVTADYGGGLNTTITIPENVLSGIKDITVEGHDSGVEGQTIFQAQPLTKTINTTITEYWRWVRTRSNARRDPVAQSFILDQVATIDGIKVYFEVLPTTDTTLVIAETSAGFPDKEKFLVSKTLTPSELTLGDSGTYFQFDSKIVLEQNKEFAFIVICDDAIGKVRCARLGEKGRKTESGATKWLTSQAYNVGVMFNSSNNSTWTPLQEEDMKFDIYSCSFSNEKTYTFPEITVSNACDFMLFANSELDLNTEVSFTATLNDNSVIDLSPYAQIPLERTNGEKYNGTVIIKATLKSSDGIRTPKLDPNIQLGVGTVFNSTDVPGGSTYTSEFFLFDARGTKVQVYLDQFKPADTSIIVAYDSVGDGTDWIDLIQISEINLENNWTETLYEYDLTAHSTAAPSKPALAPATRIRITLNSSNTNYRPVVGNLRASIQEI